jgi:hypothetical protein
MISLDRGGAPTRGAMQPRTSSIALACCLAAALFLIGAGCRRNGAESAVIVGEPAGPYRATLVLEPARPLPGENTLVTIRIEDARTSQPVTDLQVVHERMLHSFVVSRDFRHFAHTHHEDFAPLRPEDMASATFRYPHVFPRAGAYRIVVDFTHRNRTWIKRFDFVVGEAGTSKPAVLVPRRESMIGGYRFVLSVAPDPPVAGRMVDLRWRIETVAGEPVTDLAMVLGAEAHLATWRGDGEDFGHEHPWTPEMAAMMQAMQDGSADPDAMAAMMRMASSGKQYYHGPELPLRHIFPEPGVYKLFLDVAPGGHRMVADFVLRVEP